LNRSVGRKENICGASVNRNTSNKCLNILILTLSIGANAYVGQMYIYVLEST